MTAQQIINDQSLTKTERMQRLFEMGYNRPQVVQMTGWGRGFVQNVYASTYGTGRAQRRAAVAVRRYEASEFTRTFGVEIEFFGCQRADVLRALRSEGIAVQGESYNHQTRNHWKLVSDSSIRATRGQGIELVSPVLQGARGLADLEKACRALASCGALINKSCGVHIHFGVQDFNIKHWRNLYKNYLQYENVIDSMMPNSRRADRNHYCRSLTRKIGADKTAAFRKIDNCRTIQQLSNAISSRSRYCKVNAESYFRHGTVEFRQHSGTREFSKISNWIKFLNRMLDYSKQGFVSQTDTFESLTTFIEPQVHTFYHNRIQDLAA